MKFGLRRFILLQGFVLAAVSSSFAQSGASWIQDYIHPVADFPKEGVQFQWYAHLLRDPEAFAKVIREFAERYQGDKIDVIAGLDSRGFIFGAALAYELKKPFILIRKPGKLPGQVEKIDYELEYGHASFEIEVDSLKPGQKVLVIDDLMATGGTAAAACALVERLGAEVVEVACLIELPTLHGRDKVEHPVFSLVSIDAY